MCKNIYSKEPQLPLQLYMHCLCMRTTSLTSFMHTSCTSLRQLDLSHNPLGVSGIQSLETAVQSGALTNLKGLWLSNTLTDDADVNGALLTTLLQSIASHCARLKILTVSDKQSWFTWIMFSCGEHSVTIEDHFIHTLTSPVRC